MELAVLFRSCPGAVFAVVAEYYRPEPIYDEGYGSYEIYFILTLCLETAEWHTKNFCISYEFSIPITRPAQGWSEMKLPTLRAGI
jgi:hypothetical protein